MRDENLSMIEANMFLDESERPKKLTERQAALLQQVEDCYNLKLQKPMHSREQLRNYLMRKYKVSKVQAYNIIIYATVLLGNIQPSHKNWVRQRIEFLAEKAYAAVEAGNLKKAEALTKIAATLSKAFQTNLDEGEIINAQKYLDSEPITLTIDPSALKIKISEPKKKQIESMLRKYEIEDAEIIIPEEAKE